MRRKPQVYFDVAAPHKKARKPIAYHFPALAKLHLKGPHRKKKQTVFYGSLAGAFLALILFFQIPALFANVRSFTPVTCSGDWSNPTALTEKDSYGLAVATDAGQKIFCSFTTFNLKEPAPLVRATLVLSFDEKQITNTSEEPIPVEEVPEPTPEERSTEETPVETEPTSEEPTPEPEAVEEPIVEEESAPEPEPEPEPAPEEPSAFLFATVAHAQEVEEPVVEEPAPVDQTPEPVIEEVIEEPLEEVLPEVEELVEESSAPVEEDQESMLTLSYTTDGTLWTDLTTFSPRGNEVTFDLDIPTTADFDRLVVRLTAESVEEDIEVSSLEVKLWTESPIDELLAPLEVAPAVGSHLFTREFTIDPKATHYCVFEPLTIDLSAATTTTFMVSLRKGDDIGEGVTGVVADVSETILEVFTEEEVIPEPIEVLPIEEVVTEEVASTTEEVVAVEEVVETPEEEPGVIESIFEPVTEVLTDLARIKVGTLEVGSLPMGIDIRFVNESPYIVELFEDSPEAFILSALVFSPENAQEGSFSVPLVFTRTDGKESTIVCQMNIINRPGSVVIPEEPVVEEVLSEEVPLTEPTP